MGISRTGKHYPNPKFAAWSKDAIRQIRGQLPLGFQTFTEPCAVNLKYVSGDKRRRDQPAIIDALWHVLEKSGVVKDDTLLWVTDSTKRYDKKAPSAKIIIDSQTGGCRSNSAALEVE